MTLVCPQCFGEPGLQRRIQEIRSQFPNEKCSFHPRFKGIPIAAVAAIVDQVFRRYYHVGEYHRYADEQEGDPLQFAIDDLVRAEDEDVGVALMEQLIEDDPYWPPDGGEPFYDETECYARAELDDYRHSELWKNFCESIVYKQRFFNSEARKLLVEIFQDLHLQRDNELNPPVYELVPGAPNSIFTRARIAVDYDETRNFRENPTDCLSAPPARKRRPGRMNSAGIAAFYGAFDTATCVAELRPAVGSYIVSGRFALTRPIYVLDTTRFQHPIKPTSLFAKDHIRRVEQWLFMQTFMREIAQPISPQDEYLDYIPTQVVAEYFLHHHEFKKKDGPARIEGIIYQSAQIEGGRNIVLLGNAARVAQTKIVPQKKDRTASIEDVLPESMASFLTKDQSVPRPTLELEDGSLRTVSVRSARYETNEWDDIDSEDF